jgi:hypothetical protein
VTPAAASSRSASIRRKLGAAPFHLPAREVLVADIDGLKLAAVDRNARLREQAHQAAQFDKLHADLLDRWSTVLAEVGNRLVIGNQPPAKPRLFLHSERTALGRAASTTPNKGNLPAMKVAKKAVSTTTT